MSERSMLWLDSCGSERQLLKLVLADQLDHVVVAGPLAYLERVSRLGVPARVGTGYWCWEAAPTAEPDARGGPDFLQGAAGGGWTVLASGASGERTLASPEGAELARLDARTGTLSLVAGIDTTSASALVELARKSACRLLVPAGVESAPLALATDLYRASPVLLHSLCLDPLLSATALPLEERTYLVTTADVAAFGEASGDLNPLHFDDVFARAVGFEGRISHGMLFNGWLTRYLGQEHPGPGAIFLKSSSLYLAPIYPDVPHRVRISTSSFNPDKGLYSIVAQVFNPAGVTCLVAYNELVRRAPAS